MKQRKRVLALLLCAALLGASLLGCQSAPAPQESSSPASQTASSSKPEVQSEPVQTGEKPTLKYLGNSITFELTDNPMIPLIEEKTGYSVEYEALPAGDEGATKLMMLIASSAEYDLINVAPDLFDRANAAGFTTELSTLLEGTSYISGAVPADSESWDRVTSDGKVWGIPQLKPSGEPMNAIVYRKDLLNAMGLSEPTTPEEFRALLEEVKKQYPDMIPYTTNNICSAPPIESGFNCYQDWLEEDGTLTAPQNRPETKEYIEFMAKLYQDGLIDPEFPANDNAVRLQKFTSGKAFLSHFEYWEGPGFYSALETAVPGAEVGYIPYLKDKNGNSGVLTDGGGLEKVSFIPKSASHPEDAMNWIDAFAGNFLELYLGTEGESYTVEDGQYRPILPAFSDHDTVWWFMPLVQEDQVFDWWQARIRKNEEVERAYTDTFAQRTPEMTVLQGRFIKQIPDEEYTKLSAKLGQFWNDEKVKLITGAVPISDYDSIVEKWNADGGKTLTEMANEMASR